MEIRNLKLEIRNSKRSLVGFSLIEMLVVILIFSILGYVLARSLSITLRGLKKSENVSVVKENTEFALSTMERLIRNSQSLDCFTSCGSTSCTGSSLYYTDEYGKTDAYFQCVTSGTDYYIASSSADVLPDVRLTSAAIQVTNCANMFFCDNTPTIPPSSHFTDIVITAKRAGVTGVEGSEVTLRSRVLLRKY